MVNKKIVLAAVSICLFILVATYPLSKAGEQEKIYFLWSPNPHAVFLAPVGEEASEMLVWVGVLTDSTYGSARMACILNGYATDGVTIREEYHWYTDNLRAGWSIAHLSAIIDAHVTPGLEIEYDVALARIDVTASDHYLAATVIVRGEVLFNVEYWADQDAEIQTRKMQILPGLQDLSVEAWLPVEAATVTGIETGAFTGGHFDLIDTEIYDPSLLG